MIVTTNTPTVPRFLTDAGGRSITANNPLPVALAGDASGIMVAGAVFWTESDVALAAGGNAVGVARDTGGRPGAVGSRFNFFVAEVFTDQGGVLFVDKSLDGVTWRQSAKLGLSMAGSDSITLRISAPFYRARYVNGLTAQTSFLLTSAMTTA
jgi:hypothetical protein